MSEVPSISGISPSEGPLGTKITIRGQNLGQSIEDLQSVTICNVNCIRYTKWINSGKIISTIISNKIKESTKGEIIVKTKSGGTGNSTLTFLVTFSKLKPLITSSIWMEEEYEGLVPGYTEVIETDMKQIKFEPDPLGILSPNTFSSGQPSINDNLIQYSSLLSDNNFNPIRFLNERHCGTTWESFKSGYANMEKSLNVVHGANTESSGNFLIGNSNVVVGIISDMFKLSTIICENQCRTNSDIVSSIKAQIEKLNIKIVSNFDQLIQEHGKTQTYCEFLKLTNKYYTLLIVPKTINACKKDNGNYANAIISCTKLRTAIVQLSSSRFSSLAEKLEQNSNKFVTQIIQNLSKVYPIYFSGLLELLKNIDALKRDDEDYILLLLKNHQSWVSEKCSIIMNTFSSLLKKNTFYYNTFSHENQKLSSLIKNIVSFIKEFCVFFSREYNIAMNVIEWKTGFYISCLKSKKKKSDALFSLDSINEILIKLFENYFTTITALLFHPFVVLCLSDPSLGENFNTITSVPFSETLKIVESLSLVTNAANASTIHLMLDHSSISDLKLSFKFTYLDVYHSKYTILCRKIGNILKNHAYLCTSNTLTDIIEDEYTYESIEFQYDYKSLVLYQIIHNWISKFLLVINKVLNQQASIEHTRFIESIEVEFYCSLDSLTPIFSTFLLNFQSSKSVTDIKKILLAHLLLKKINENLEIKLKKLAKDSKIWLACAPIQTIFSSSIETFSKSIDSMNDELLSCAITLCVDGFKETITGWSNITTSSCNFNFSKQLILKCIEKSLIIKKICFNYNPSFYREVIQMFLNEIYVIIKETISSEFGNDTIEILCLNIFYIDSIFASFFGSDGNSNFRSLFDSITMKRKNIKDIIKNHSLKSSNFIHKWIKIFEPSL